MELHPISLSLIIFIMSGYFREVISIYEGQDVEDVFFWYQVSVWRQNQHVCGGAIIDEWHVLTAGHCFEHQDHDDVLVYANSPDLKSEHIVIHEVESITRHRNYNLTQVSCGINGKEDYLIYAENDLAMLTLTVPLNFGTYNEPVNLPTSDPFCASHDEVCEVAGWGWTQFNVPQISNNLQWTEVRLLRYQECAAVFPTFSEDFICAQDPELKSALLQGDSGSPLVCGGELVGIVSTAGTPPYVPSTYVNVFRYLDFIMKTSCQ